MFGRILKRYCHDRDTNIAKFLKPYNPLVECEKAYTIPHFENTNPPSIENTRIFRSLIGSFSNNLRIHVL